MYLQDRRKTKGWKPHNLANQIDTRRHTMVTRTCSAYLAANSTLKNSHSSLPGTVPKKFRISRKNLAERDKQHLKIVQKRNQTKLNSGSTNAETPQASWPTAGPLQGGGTPYDSREKCHTVTETLNDTGKTWKKFMWFQINVQTCQLLCTQIKETLSKNDMQHWYVTIKRKNLRNQRKTRIVPYLEQQPTPRVRSLRLEETSLNGR